MSIIKEFKEFIQRGNIVDLATAVVVGGAFGKITSSLVDDIIMPPLGLILGKVNFRDLKIVMLDKPEGEADVTLNYGNFLQTVFDFAIIAFAIFLVIKAYNQLQRKEAAKEAAAAPATPPAPPAPTKEEILLTEIRDLLASKQ